MWRRCCFCLLFFLLTNDLAPVSSIQSPVTASKISVSSTQSPIKPNQNSESSTPISAASTHNKVSVSISASLRRNFSEIVPGKAGEDPVALRKTLKCHAEEGTWVQNRTPRHLPWVRPTYGITNQCDREYRFHYSGHQHLATGILADRAADGGGGKWLVPNETLWEYQADKCPLETVSYEKFCRTMWAAFGLNASILIVGGDHAWGLERRLFYNLVATGPKNPVVINMFPDFCSSWNPHVHPKFCSGYRYGYDVMDGNSVAIRFMRSNNLSVAMGNVGGVNAPWLTFVSLFRPTILVLNHDMPNTTLEEFRFRLTNALFEISKRREDVRLIVYMATPLVHTCHAYGLEAWEKHFSPQDFSDYAAQNKIAEEIMQQENGLYLDLATPLSRRPTEMLRDLEEFHSNDEPGCINPCRVGHADAWASLFLNLVTTAFADFVPDLPKNGSTYEFDKDVKVRERLHAKDQFEEAPEVAPHLNRHVPGSSLRTLQATEELQRRMQCNSEEGRWVYNPTPRILPWPKQPIKYIRGSEPCDADWVRGGGIAYEDADRAALNGTEWKVRESVKWEWETPTHCQLEKITHDSFCRVLGPRRSILLIGDSLSLGLFRNFHANIQMDADLERDPTIELFPNDPLRAWDVGTRFKLCLGYSVCNDVWGEDDAVQFRFCFNKQLSLTRVPLNSEAPWVLMLTEWKPDIVILNSGAHYRSDDLYESGTRASLWYIRSKLPKSLIMWRNTPPGHLNCTAYDRPLDRPQNKSDLPFHWGDFARQNEIAKRLVKEVGGVYVDVATMSELRADAHFGTNYAKKTDCLHFCQPGVLDTWVQLIYNAFIDLL
eukprot:TRINITY_DN17235_c0_g1_i1.p1 TRINITY_DN17235_c0_g1~~TRINITY_DN17235_c0_g1_i1.p1  ORF type:complete len:830 (-),score=50.50 TRINITY_DN17235_c0_g1_i1:449-2938(-)